MDIFRLRDQLVSDYEHFTSSFVQILDEDVRAHVTERVAGGYQWPDPWLSLNPNFATGGSISELITDGLLHPDCADVFQRKDSDDAGPELRLHQHQREAIEVARTGASYVLTTGTGSGKSLTYIIPIVDRVLRMRAMGTYRPGVKALVVYPMNALANSQLHELEKFLHRGFPDGPPVTFARYTGQENMSERQRILSDPPDILLTNYVMLELMLTRPKERRALVESAKGLEFLVLDELHTYRGRQGADVALLVRRLRDACGAAAQCVGTSATMTTEGDQARQRERVAGVATQLFGAEVRPEHVIGETLQRVTDPAAISASSLGRAVSDEPTETADEFENFVKNPLSAWVEETFGFDPDESEPGAGRMVRRRRPLTIPDAAELLREKIGGESKSYEEAIRANLERGARVTNPSTGRPVFAFRVHQFLSKGDNVYVTLEPPDSRHITSKYQKAIADADGNVRRLLLPLVFCRECGQEYLAVGRQREAGQWTYAARQDSDSTGADSENGYLYLSNDMPWPPTLQQVLEQGRLPYSWVTANDVGTQVVTPSREKYLPEAVRLDVEGHEARDGAEAAYIPGSFRFCLRCRTSYEQARGDEFGRLAKLSAEGRSSAMSLISTSVVASLRAHGDDLDRDAKKLLAFVDNRQDAALQAGHFNDFVLVTQLRSALYRALRKAPDGLEHDVLPQRVTDELGLVMADFARMPEAQYGQKRNAWRALREVTGYRLYLDLERGWRITMPNLEQTGLLRIDYPDLAELAEDEDAWRNSPERLANDRPEHRYEVANALLGELRRSLAIDVPYLTEDGFDEVRRLSEQHLLDPWALPPRERPPVPGRAYPGPSRPDKSRRDLYLSGLGAYGRYLRFQAYQEIGVSEATDIIESLLDVMRRAGLLSELSPAFDGGANGYQLRASAIRWMLGDGEHGVEDLVRRTFAAEAGPRVNPFFRHLYRETASTLTGLRAKEHTAQVSREERETRERDFSEADLPVLYCSPTMELGVDIKSLNAVALRNVPPTPANYAQRAGRAGRSGQPALVVSYCATGNAHDQYYFRNPTDMVGGAVSAPRLDLANEDLVRSHVHAVWLAETGKDLGGSLTEVLNASSERPTLQIDAEVWKQLTDPGARRRAAERARSLLANVLPELQKAPWWRPRWLDDAVDQAPAKFREACRRWQDLYRIALQEYHSQSKRAVDISVRQAAREIARQRERDAWVQLRLLRNDDSQDFQTDFYSYRYFASEGFLPGYSFPRLPLSAYIPGLAGKREGDYIQRPRFIGIREFGPGAVIYHEGGRYVVASAQLPPREAGAIDEDAVPTSSARRCGACGYLHDVRDDVCRHCGQQLAGSRDNLLRLTSVRTMRRDRISSDEEERRRSRFELQTSYQFADHGGRPGKVDVAVRAVETNRPVLFLTYGEGATLRVTNLGRLGRKTPDGFPIEVSTGRWLKESDAEDQAPEDAELYDPESRRRSQRVVPYVEDRRNILALRLPSRISEQAAVSFMTAMERGIEAVFQLEDGELASELLPDPDGRGRALLVESAEGGAGVLRRLVEDPRALGEVAAKALEITHFNSLTGDDEAESRAGQDACALACYECLLSYSNQPLHGSIDRRTSRDILLELTSAEIDKSEPSVRTVIDAERQPVDGLVAEFLAWLRAGDYRLPDETASEVFGTVPDLVFRLDKVAVFLGLDHGPGRDRSAEEDLMDEGWTVIRVPSQSAWPTTVEQYSSVFGSPRGNGS